LTRKKPSSAETPKEKGEGRVPGAVSRPEFMKTAKKKRARQRKASETSPASSSAGNPYCPTLDIAPKQDLLTSAEAATYLRISPSTLLRVAKAGEVGHVKVGGRVRFLLEDLDRYARGEPHRPGAQLGWDRLRAPKGSKQEK